MGYLMPILVTIGSIILFDIVLAVFLYKDDKKTDLR